MHKEDLMDMQAEYTAVSELQEPFEAETPSASSEAFRAVDPTADSCAPSCATPEADSESVGASAESESELRLRAFLEVAAKGLLSRPDELVIRISKTDKMGLLASLHCDPEDTGRLIGKRGRTVKALRALCWALGQRLGTPVDLEVLD